MNYLVVGCGITGITIAERIASILKERVLIIDNRSHIGGNCYDSYENNICVHKYGTHIFHTDNKEVWDYLSKFTDWHIYMHKVKGIIDGIEMPIPFNLNSLYLAFPKNFAEKIEKKLFENFEYGKKIPILELKKVDDKDLKILADYIYNKVFLGYTLKQWGLKPEELDSSVTARVPIHFSRDDRYFQNKYQGIPLKGYTEMFKNMLNNPLIEIRLNTNFKDIKEKFKKIYYTGAIDEYFNYKFGELPYRSLKFDFKLLNREYYQSNSVINYPENYDFTRIGEYKYFLNDKSDKTVVSFEYPQSFKNGYNERYYPIINDKNNELYQKYLKEAKKDKDIIFLGRLGEYKYYDMDKAVEKILDLEW